MEIIIIVMIGLVTGFILMSLSTLLDKPKVAKDYVAFVHINLPWSCGEWEQFELKAEDVPEACIKLGPIVREAYPDATNFCVHEIRPATWNRS